MPADRPPWGAEARDKIKGKIEGRTEARQASVLTVLEARSLAVSEKQRGNFAPPRRDPRAEWYADLLSGLGPNHGER